MYYGRAEPFFGSLELLVYDILIADDCICLKSINKSNGYLCTAVFTLEKLHTHVCNVIKIIFCDRKSSVSNFLEVPIIGTFTSEIKYQMVY